MFEGSSDFNRIRKFLKNWKCLNHLISQRHSSNYHKNSQTTPNKKSISTPSIHLNDILSFYAKYHHLKYFIFTACTFHSINSIYWFFFSISRVNSTCCSVGKNDDWFSMLNCLIECAINFRLCKKMFEQLERAFEMNMRKIFKFAVLLRKIFFFNVIRNFCLKHCIFKE